MPAFTLGGRYGTTMPSSLCLVLKAGGTSFWEVVYLLVNVAPRKEKKKEKKLHHPSTPPSPPPLDVHQLLEEIHY